MFTDGQHSVIKKMINKDRVSDGDLHTKLESADFEGFPRSRVTIGDMIDMDVRAKLEKLTKGVRNE